MIPDKVRPVLARVIGAVVASAVTALFRHLGHEVTDDQRGAISDLGVALIFGVWGLVYAGVHKWTSAHTNPADAATGQLAKVATGPLGAEKREQLAEGMRALATGEFTGTTELAAPRPSLTDHDRGVV